MRDEDQKTQAELDAEAEAAAKAKAEEEAAKAAEEATDKEIKERFGDKASLLKSYKQAEAKITGQGQTIAAQQKSLEAGDIARKKADADGKELTEEQQYRQERRELLKQKTEAEFAEDTDKTVEIEEKLLDLDRDRLRKDVASETKKMLGESDAERDQRAFEEKWTRDFYERFPSLDDPDFAPHIAAAEREIGAEMDKAAIAAGKDPKTAYTYNDLYARMKDVGELAKKKIGAAAEKWSKGGKEPANTQIEESGPSSEGRPHRGKKTEEEEIAEMHADDAGPI